MAPRLWVARDCSVYSLRIEYPSHGPARLIFSHLGERGARAVPVHPSVSLGRLSRDELEELLSEAREFGDAESL